MGKRGKKYREAAAKIEEGKLYAPKAAMSLLKETVTVNFDPTIDVVFRLGVDPRQADQMVRGAVSLPHGTGQSATVAVITSGEKIAAAQEAGADHVGGDDLVEQLESLVDELDAIVATPDMMGKLGRLGKVLGPRGLMPNPKSGTVTQDVAKAVREIKGGRVEYRVDRTANIHTILGKGSFTAEQLLGNFEALFDEISRQRPASAKGKYVKTIAISATMGPAIHIDPTRAKDLITEDEDAA